MDKRILVGMTLVVLLCAGVWWFVSPANQPMPAIVQPTSGPSREIAQAPPVDLTPAEITPTELAPAGSTSDTQRSIAITPTPTAATATKADTALLKLLVLDQSTRRPMPGVKVLSSYDEKGGRSFGEDHGLSRGKPWDMLRTDADGRVEIEAPAHTDLHVTARADRADAGDAYKTIPAVEAGTVTDIVLEIPSGADLPYWMKLVDETTRDPLAGAKVNFEEQHQADQSLTCDAQGFVFVSTRSWTQTQLQVRAQDHAQLYVHPERGHERIEDAYIVALPASATLRAHVVDGNGVSVVAARIVLSTRGYRLAYAHDVFSGFMPNVPDPQWEGLTDAIGIATITGLPPRVPIKAGIESPKQWTSAEDLTFQPAETRDVEWKLTSGCQVHGTLLDQTNAPVVAREMWLRKAEGKIPAYFRPSSSGETRKTVSDQQGRFQFGTVSRGTWWVGPGPVERDRIADADDVAALAQVVEVVEGQNDVDLTLRVDRGLLISGKVLDAKGTPVDGGFVSAFDKTALLSTYTTLQVADGRFAIGPLMAGRYAVQARGHGSDAASLPVEVDAGSRDVVLQLRQGATVAGTVVDENGRPIPAVVCVSKRDSEFGMHIMSPREDGTFRLQGLEPGTYQVTAHTSDGHIGIAENVEASTTDAPPTAVVQLRLGGHVRVRQEGPEKNASIRLFQNGIEFASDGVELGGMKDMVAPVGTVVVRAGYYEAKRSVQRTVEVKAGETVDVVFEKDAH